MEEYDLTADQINELGQIGSDNPGLFAGLGIGMMVFLIAFYVFMIASQWKVFAKAGQPGWAVLVPIYNIIVMFKVARVPGWWFVMFFIPIANIIFMVKLTHAISKNFGKDGGFTAGLIFLPFVFWPILGFGSAQYQVAEATGSEDVLDA